MKFLKKIGAWFKENFTSDKKELAGEPVDFTKFKDPVLCVTFDDGTRAYCELDIDPTQLVLQKCLDTDSPVFANYSVVERP